jgi:steroid 5-alpha reductase family enzyme
MTVWFIIAQIKKDNSIVDIAWGLGFILVAFLSLKLNQNYGIQQRLVAILVLIWGIRLSVHIFFRNLGRGEDFRYKNWRDQWGNKAILYSFLKVFMLQGLVLTIVAYPIMLINSYPINRFNALVIIGFIIWLTGFLVESIGDYQLYRFKKNPENKGKIMKSGLWRYTRHPNYFGESLIWWGIFLIVLPAPYGWTTIISPILMTFLLVKVSGKPMLEEKYSDNPEYQEYQRNTSGFIPWFPKDRK